METTILTAPDIECAGCVNAIKKALGTVPGIAGVDVDIAAKQVTVTHGPAVTQETIIAALDRAGFPVAA